VTDNKVLQTTISHQKANLDKYTKHINELTVSIKLKASLLKTRKKELADAKKDYARLEGIYNRDKKKRSQEKTIIHRLQKIVNDRLARMSQFLKAGVNK